MTLFCGIHEKYAMWKFIAEVVHDFGSSLHDFEVPSNLMLAEGFYTSLCSCFHILGFSNVRESASKTWVNIRRGNGFVPDGNKPSLADPVLTADLLLTSPSSGISIIPYRPLTRESATTPKWYMYHYRFKLTALLPRNWWVMKFIQSEMKMWIYSGEVHICNWTNKNNIK